MTLTGLQREVLALYRQCLRAADKKPTSHSRDVFRLFARGQFRRAADHDKKDFAMIEYLVRKGRRQLELFSSPDIKSISQSSEDGASEDELYGWRRR
ncbi:MAG: hypothetical protein M1826_000241 [Phylliscum demangeonii]|nr:MAG: hypothetical protein M1826_000241 [Phylliscum demangeonii]